MMDILWWMKDYVSMWDMYNSVCVLVCASIIILLWIIRAKPFHKDIPTPPTVWLLGNYFYISEFLAHPVELILKFTKEFGRSWGMRVPVENGALFVHDPECVEYVLKTNFSNYVKGPEFQFRLRDLLGHGIFNSDGEQWRLQRKTASHMFTTRELRGFMCDTFNKHGLAVCEVLDRAADSGECVDLHQLFYQYTLDSICMIAFGFNLNTLGATVDKRSARPVPFTPEQGLEFARLFDETQELCEKRFYQLGFKFKRLASFVLPWLFPAEVKIRENCKRMNEMAYAIIADRRSDDSLNYRDDLLSLFLRHRSKEHFSDEYLRDVLMNFLIAGRDTTAQALAWTHFMLMENPHVNDRLYEEVISATGGADGVVDFDVCRQLVYTEAVVCETLRLYPSVPKDIKMSVNSDVWPDGTRVPAKVMIVYSPWAMGRLESLWPNPLNFDPQRWLKSGKDRKLSDTTDAQFVGAAAGSGGDSGAASSSTTTVSPVLRMSPYKFTAFQAGPRTCLGRMVALLESKMLTALIAQRFTLTLKPGHHVTHRNSLTLPMLGGLPVTVKRR